MPTCKKCGVSFPNRITVEGGRRNISRRKFCLTCSPWGSRNRKDLSAPSITSGVKTCPRCGDVKELTEFYTRRRGKESEPSSYCKACAAEEARGRMRALKARCVEYKGGGCRVCGYSKSLAALDFHHRDPKEKGYGISQIRGWKFERVKEELDKCDLLCRNCHSEVHDEAL